ncbi:SsrA-binding protein [Candidatus Gracilibacteria bacterium CG2_30_37_12]|nr:MAG: SsrA-binding protein [Candidatus Gracilibacteria bacterium CG2_30_37_12]
MASLTTSLHVNKKALFDYEIVQGYEAGIKLTGPEVKSVRAKQCNLKGSYVSLASGRPILKGLHISPYEHLPHKLGIDPSADREIFLHKKTIDYLTGKLKEKGFSLIPTEVYSKGNLIKISVALARGRKVFEKKQVLKERDVNRDMEREIGRY